MKRIAKPLIAAAPVFMVLTGGGLALADSHGEVRELVEQGRILPLQTVLQRGDLEQGGQLLEAELEMEDGIWVYELELLRDDGRVYELYYDAGTGEHLPDFDDH